MLRRAAAQLRRASQALTAGQPGCRSAEAGCSGPATASLELCRSVQRTPACWLGRRCFASTSADLSSLTTAEIHSILDSANVDYRDCLERAELIQRLSDAEKVLPSQAKARLQYLLHRRTAPSVAEAAAPPLASAALFDDEQYVVSLFQAAKPSAVHITTSKPGLQLFGQGSQPSGSGSGFVWDEEGHCVTNYHVIRDMSSVKVTLVDNRSYDAVVRGVEPDKDLAVLKIQSPPRLTPISVGSSSGLQVGQRVFAIGFPFALDQSLTAGIVSGLGREITGVSGRTIRDVVQTDAAINPGNSGGPLLDSRGRLIGVNTMIVSRSGTSSGVGFCIPSDTVRRVVNQIIRFGRVIRPGLGLMLIPDDAAANVLGPGNRGVIIRSVVPGSGAEQAQLRGLTSGADGTVGVGDVIVSVAGQPVVGVDDVNSAMEQFNVGDTVALGIKRGADVVLVNVPLLKELGR